MTERTTEAVPEPTAEAWQALAEATDAAIAADEQQDQDDEPTAEDSSDDAESQPTNREARYRLRAKEAEAERDRLTEQLTVMRRSQIEALTASAGIKPAALWASGAKIEDLLGDDGVPAPEKITAAVAAARHTLGIQNVTRAQLGTRSGSGAGVSKPAVNKWEAAFAPNDE